MTQPNGAGDPVPSLYGLRCAACGSPDVYPTAVQNPRARYAKNAPSGQYGPEMAAWAARGYAGVDPVWYTCVKCGSKAPSFPHPAGPEEFLASPATIRFTRRWGFWTWGTRLFAYLNGVPVSEVTRREPLVMTTPLRFNTLFVVNAYRLPLERGCVRFEAQPGGVTEFTFDGTYR